MQQSNTHSIFHYLTIAFCCGSVLIFGIFSYKYVHDRLNNYGTLTIRTEIINNDNGSAVISGIASTLVVEGEAPKVLLATSEFKEISIVTRTYRVEPQSIEGYNVQSSRDCTGYMTSQGTMECVVTYNDIPPNASIVVNKQFKAQASDFLDSPVKPIVYTLVKADKIYVDEGLPDYFRRNSVPFAKEHFTEGRVALVLTIQQDNLNALGSDGTNYGAPSLQNIARLVQIGGEKVNDTPKVVADLYSIKHGESNESVAVFSIPQHAQSGTVLLGFRQSPLMLSLDFASARSTVLEEQMPQHDLPGCNFDLVDINDIKVIRAGGAYAADSTLLKGEQGSLQYSWKGGGTVTVSPEPRGYKSFKYQATAFIAPKKTTVFTLTPNADPDCAKEFTVFVK